MNNAVYLSEMIDEQYLVLIEFLGSDGMRVAAKNSLKQGFAAGTGAIAGAILLGPVGGLVGGTTGSFIGYLYVQDYKGAIQLMSELEQKRKRRLIKAIIKVLIDAGASQLVACTSVEGFKKVLYSAVVDYFVRDQIWKIVCQEIDRRT